MKNFCLVTAIIFLFSFQSNCQGWEWATQLGYNSQLNNESISNIISDGTNYYAIGNYWGTLNTPGGKLFSNGLNDIFIIKFDANGNQLWAKSLGGNYAQPDNNEDGYGIYDPINKCIYLAGQIIGTVEFEPNILVLNAQSNAPDAFVAKMDLNGHFSWANRIGGTGIDQSSCYVEPNGNVTVVGKLQNSGSCNGISVAAGGFFARFDTDGNLKWIEQKFNGVELYCMAFIDTDILMAGYFSSIATIDTASITSKGSWDGFLTRTDSLGHVKWIKTFGNNDLDGISAISTDNLNNIYITGAFKDSINIDGMILRNVETDLLLAKFNEDGNLIWAKQAQIQGNSQVFAGLNLLSDPNGNTYSTGVFSGTATFGDHMVHSTNPSEMFLARFDNNGNCIGVLNFGSAKGSGIAVDNNLSVICAGSFQNTVTIGSTTLSSFGGKDIFIAKSGEINGIQLNKQAKVNQLSIYSNPTTGRCILSIPYEFLSDNMLILTIVNIMGSVIQQKTLVLNEEKITIDLDAEAKGIYIAKLSNGVKEYFGKIVFE